MHIRDDLFFYIAMQPSQKNITIPTNESVLNGHALVPEHVRTVVDLVSNGRDKESISIGFHGTSLGALLVAMKTGYIPTGRSKGCEGHLYFFPTSHADVTREGLALLGETPAEVDRKAFTEAAWYARVSSQALLAATAFRLDLSSEVGWRTSLSIEDIASGSDSAGLALLEKAGFTQRDIQAFERRVIRVEKGFVLLLAASALHEHSHYLGDEGYGDLKIRLPEEGLSLKHLVGIDPLSEEDFDTIESLEETYGAGS